jgi:hypothetical protein
MKLGVIALLMVIPAVAVAAPKVRTTKSDCTTEPAPADPAVKVLRDRGGTVKVRVIGEGSLCAAGWTVRVDGKKVTLVADHSVDAPGCPGSCAIWLRVTGLKGGTHEVAVERGP